MKNILSIVGLVLAIIDLVCMILLAFDSKKDKKLSGKNDKMFDILLVLVCICSGAVLIINIISLFLK